MVQCDRCGNLIAVKPTVLYRALQPRGSGWKGAGRIKRLNRTQVLALRVLIDGIGGFPATDFNSGMELTDAWKAVRDIVLRETPKDMPLRVPTKQGVSGRLCELQGLHLTVSENNIVELQDAESMRFRGQRHKQRWFLADIEKARKARWSGVP